MSRHQRTHQCPFCGKLITDTVLAIVIHLWHNPIRIWRVIYARYGLRAVFFVMLTLSTGVGIGWLLAGMMGLT